MGCRSTCSPFSSGPMSSPATAGFFHPFFVGKFGSTTWQYHYLIKVIDSIFTHIYIYVCLHVCMHACMYLCIYVSMYACMHACMYLSMYLCIYVSMYACICYIYICICTYMLYQHGKFWGIPHFAKHPDDQRRCCTRHRHCHSSAPPAAAPLFFPEIPWIHRKTMGKPWENHRKTIGKVGKP